MSGRLAELMGVESMSLELDPRHFPLLRLAQLRRLKATRLRPGVWAVSSHSQRGHWHKVASGVCSCPAIGFCTHAALALDAEIKRDAVPSAYVEYMNAAREDFKELELRILHSRTTAEDRAFVRPHAERVRASLEPYETPERAEVNF
jgi:hypothetical protein